MKVSLVLAGVLVVGIAFFAGCELFDTGGSTDRLPAELSEYGGFTTDDEAPGFGDSDLLAGYPEDEKFEDDMEDDPRVVDAMRQRGANHYVLRIVWGNLETPDSRLTDGADCPVTDWSGSMEADNAVIIVKRLIRFEPGDYIVRPRKGPRRVDWVSYTKDHVDGILFKIVAPPDPTASVTDGTVKISTPFYEGEIPLALMDDYRELVVYDDCNKISIVATRVKPSDCPRGFLEGGWIAESDTSGHFRGAWIGAEGRLMGYLKGRYDLRDGHRVLYGKWITESGNFQGLLRGTWTPLMDDEGPDGIFEGRWVNAAFTVAGSFKGHYHIAEGDTSGFFQGRWMKNCR